MTRLPIGLGGIIAAALAIGAALPAGAATERVGSIGEIVLIDRLDIGDLPSGSVQRFWFRAADNVLGQPWLVPVIVIKGAKPGPRLLVTAGIHGDELNGIDVIHRIAEATDAAVLAGTLVLVPGLNTPGLLQSTREFSPDYSRASANLNRSLPGDESRGGVDGYAGRLWNRLLRPNADQAVDLHTQSRGTAYPLYAFASTPRARAMAALMAPDIIKIDPGVKGSVETEMVRDGVPAITLELGTPEVFNAEMITRGVAGITNLMRDMGMIAGTPVPASAETYVGNKLEVVRAPRAGWARLLAPLGSAVAKGQMVATMEDAFGRVTNTLVAPLAGRISSSFTDPRRDKGDTIVRIIFMSEDPKCVDGC
jgi:hypothetical protein